MDMELEEWIAVVGHKLEPYQREILTKIAELEKNGIRLTVVEAAGANAFPEPEAMHKAFASVFGENPMQPELEPPAPKNRGPQPRRAFPVPK